MPILLASGFSDAWVALPWEGLRVWGTFFAVGIGALFALGAYRRETRRDRDRELREIAAQASKVTAWVEIDHGIIRVRNASDLPVELLIIWIGKQLKFAAPAHRGRKKYLTGYDVLADSMRPFWPMGVLLPAESGRQFEEIHLGRLVNTYGDNPRIGLSFGDAQGVQWVRVDGQLFNDSDARPQSWLRSRLRRTSPEMRTLPKAITLSEI